MICFIRIVTFNSLISSVFKRLVLLSNSFIYLALSNKMSIVDLFDSCWIKSMWYQHCDCFNFLAFDDACNIIIHTSFTDYEHLFIICILCNYCQHMNFYKLHCSLMYQKAFQIVWEFLFACRIWLRFFISKRIKILRIIIRILYNFLVLCIDILPSFSDLYNEFQIVSFSFLCSVCLNCFFYINMIKLLFNNLFACVVTSTIVFIWFKSIFLLWVRV